MKSQNMLLCTLLCFLANPSLRAENFCKLLASWPTAIVVSDLIEEINQLGELPNSYFNLNLEFQAWPISGWTDYKTLTGDVNGDGLTDLIWNITNSSANSMYVSLSNGDGTFNLLPNVQTWPIAGWSAFKTLTGDLNGDGRTDLIWNATTASANATYVGLSNGDGTFNLLPNAQTWPISGWSAFKTLTGDLNGDGRTDLIWNATTASANATYIGLSKGDGTFNLLPNAQTWPISGWSAFKTLTGDLNGDGRTDLIWNANTASANATYVGLSNGDGTFNLLPNAQTWPISGWSAFKTLTGDLNGDGRTDLIWNATTVSGNTSYIGLSNGDGTLNLLPNFQTWPIAGWSTFNTFTGDFNGDGLTDLLWNVLSNTANTFYVGLSNGDGTLKLITQFQTWGIPGWVGYQTLTGELNGDGMLDLIWNKVNAAGNTIYTGLADFELICVFN